MAWRPAKSVALGLAEATKRWPNRNKASDGILGNAAHAARQSDHNPDPRGIVHAFDLTHDPAHGVDCAKLSAHIVNTRDPRLRYVIWNRRIALGPYSSGVMQGTAKPWQWRAYTGPNPHDHHMHVSVGYGLKPENDVSPWYSGGSTPPPEDWFDMATKAELKAVVDDSIKDYFGKIIGAGQASYEGTVEATLRVGQAAFNEARASKVAAQAANEKLEQGGVVQVQVDATAVAAALATNDALLTALGNKVAHELHERLTE